MLNDQVIYHGMKATDRGIVQGGSTGIWRPFASLVGMPKVRGIVYPDPDCKMWLVWVKHVFYPFFHIWHHMLKLCMVNPVFGSISGKREFPQAVSGDVFI